MTQFNPEMMLFPGKLLLTVRMPMGVKIGAKVYEHEEEVGTVIDFTRASTKDSLEGYQDYLVKITKRAEYIRKMMEQCPDSVSLGHKEDKHV